MSSPPEGNESTWAHAERKPTDISVSIALREAAYRRIKLIRSAVGGGMVPADEHKDAKWESDSECGVKSQRMEKQRSIAHIIPVHDVTSMAGIHWDGIFALERRYLPMDWHQSTESAILGAKQANVNRDHRHRIVKWMAEACGLFKWASQTFFTAVHAWDYYMTTVAHVVTTSDLAKLSAACLYFGAQLVESAADENVKTLEEFTEICPEVGSPHALREVQAHLVDTLQGISLIRRTPVDFLLLYLAQMQVAPSPCPELFQSLLHQNLLDVVWDLVTGVALTIYANGLVLDGLPGSRWVAGALLRILEFSCPSLRTDLRAREILRCYVFHIPPGVLEAYQSIAMDPIIKSVWQHSLDSVLNGAEQPSENRSPNRKIKPHSVIRHLQPPLFPQWPITFPSNRVVQNVSSRLRATSFETCTPPNVSTAGCSISAAKRAVGDKSKRHSATPGAAELPQRNKEDENMAPDDSRAIGQASTPHYPELTG